MKVISKPEPAIVLRCVRLELWQDLDMIRHRIESSILGRDSTIMLQFPDRATPEAKLEFISFFIENGYSFELGENCETYDLAQYVGVHMDKTKPNTFKLFAEDRLPSRILLTLSQTWQL